MAFFTKYEHDVNRCGFEPDKLAPNPDAEIAPALFLGSPTGPNSANTSSIHAPTGSLLCENLDGPRPLEKPILKYVQTHREALIVTEDSFGAPFVTLGREDTTSDCGGKEQSTEQDRASKSKKPKMDCKIPLSQEISDHSNRILTWSSPSIVIGDELAAIHAHMDHCQNTDCLSAKAFFDRIQPPRNTLPTNSSRPKQIHERSEEGRVTMRFYVPKIQKGSIWPKGFIVNQVIIRTSFSPDIPCSLETFEQDDALSGRGAMVVSLEGQDLESFVTFSPKIHQVEHSTNIRASRKLSYGDVIFESVMPERVRGASSQYGFKGRFSIELYDRWPPLASNYEVREDWFGDISLVVHSDIVDPKCFLAFSSTPYSAGHKCLLPTHCKRDTNIPEKTYPAGTSSVGGNQPLNSHAGSLKRESSYVHEDQYELRRSKRLSQKTQA